MDQVLHHQYLRLPPNDAVVEVSTVVTDPDREARRLTVLLQLPAGWVVMTPRAAHQLGAILMAEATATVTMAKEGADRARAALNQSRQASLTEFFEDG